MYGIDAQTGKPLSGLPHVMQSIEKIFTTWLSQRAMREWFGTPANIILGKNMTDATILEWWTIVWVALELFEPRFRAVMLEVPEADRLGRIAFILHGEYRPYAHRDWVQAKLYIAINDDGVAVRDAA